MPGTGKTLNAEFFGRDFYHRHCDVIRGLTLKECLNDNNSVKSLMEFIGMGLPLSAAKYLELVGALLDWKTNLRLFSELQDVNFSVQNFIESTKKGSKKLRKILSDIENFTLNLKTLSTVTTHCRLIDCAVPEPTILKTWLAVWNSSFLPNEFRTFVFNCRFNSLPLNNRLNAYIQTIDSRCTFCRIIDNNTNNRDSYIHCFYTCMTTNMLIRQLCTTTGLDVDLNSVEFKNLYWFGIDNNEQMHQFVWNIFFDTVRFVIFKCRRRKNVPNINMVLNDVLFWLGKFCNASKKFKSRFFACEKLTWFSRALG
jgi:hypothetical protein